ncbi:MAG: hypothetical protein HZT43_20295 [Exiguobacterium profundum]|nr:MAG: hypothetical protein HZT43_20295 [Exiguobacterium profundum]
MNVEFDKAVFRPAAEGTEGLLPDEAEVAIMNAADTWNPRRCGELPVAGQAGQGGGSHPALCHQCHRGIGRHP